MYRDEIITEVWRLRDQYADQHNHNMTEIIADLKKRQQTPHSKLIDLRDRTKRSAQPENRSDFLVS